jgi:tyrosinase
MTSMDRRTVLKHGAALALASTLPATEAQAQTVLLRRSVGSMAANDPILMSYRAAIRAMQALPTTDPRNWTGQAQIHNNFCPHNNWFFLPWHRAYLVAFERLCRQLSGNPNFALPYWDWTANPQLPVTFATENFMGQPNPLFNSTRSSQTVTIPPNVAGTAVMASILAENSFEVFASSRPTGQNSTAATWLRRNGITGPLESTPHNQVHNRVSGDMATLMSPLDPIFWLHHCNIDRLWDRWNRAGRTNTASTLWRNFAFNGHFVNPSGASGTTPFNVAVSGLLNIETLGYRYIPPLLAPAQLLVTPSVIDLNRLPPVARLENIPAAQVNTPLNMPVQLNQTQARALARIQPVSVPTSFTAARPVRAPGRVVAIMRDVEPPKNGNTEVRVFVNCPYLSPEVPPQDRHYAGAFTFFGTEHVDHNGKPSYLVDLTETVRRLRIAEVNLQDEVNVQLMPVPIPGVPSADVQFQVASVEVAIV